MFGSRMAAAGVVLVLISAFFFSMRLLVVPLMNFMMPDPSAWSDPDGSDDGPEPAVIVNSIEPTRLSLPPAGTYPVLGLAVGLGSLVWLRCARRGPYLRVTAVLLGVAAVGGAMAAFHHRDGIAAECRAQWLWANPDILYMRTANEVHAAISQLPLVAAAGVMAVATAIGLTTGLLGRRKAEPDPPDAPFEKG